MRYGMVIDLRRCIGCNACSIACKQKNATGPGVFYSRVLISEVGKYPNARMTPLPLLCMHCDEPPCESVCPTGATHRLANGVVIVDEQMCIGCRACMIACPYNARFFNMGKPKPYYPELGFTVFEEVSNQGLIVGTVGKCDFCIDRVEAGMEPSCVQTCPPRARFFGDLDDSNSEVSQLIMSRNGYALHTELGTKPSVYYLPA